MLGCLFQIAKSKTVKLAKINYLTASSEIKALIGHNETCRRGTSY